MKYIDLKVLEARKAEAFLMIVNGFYAIVLLSFGLSLLFLGHWVLAIVDLLLATLNSSYTWTQFRQFKREGLVRDVE